MVNVVVVVLINDHINTYNSYLQPDSDTEEFKKLAMISN